MYSFISTTDSPLFGPMHCQILSHYYVAIQINVDRSGVYSFSSRNSMELNIYGSLYMDYFNAFNPQQTLIPIKDDSCFDNEFVITIRLQSNITYVLVVTTIAEMTIGNFSIVASGPYNVTLNEISELKRISSLQLIFYCNFT